MAKLRVLVFYFVLLSLYAPGQTGKGPVARYSFNNGDASDEAGNNNGRGYGLRLTSDRFGNEGSAYFFHGNKDSYLNLGTSPVLKPKEGSVSLWVKVDQPIYRGRGILINPIIQTRAHSYNDFCEAYAVSYNFDLRRFTVGNSLAEAQQVSLCPLANSYLHRWYHLVLTYSNKYTCFYIDGVLEARCAKDFETRFLSTDSVILGSYNAVRNSRYFQGAIDDIEIYDRVLSPAEVFQLYNAPNPNKDAIIRKWLLIGLCFVVLISLVTLWVKRRIVKAVNAEKEKSRLNNRLIELETRAIRAQMNPHFIFNSLNTLQRFILEDDKNKSYTYLIEFSKLLRKLLESSESDTISLKEEIEILTAYLEIEKLRFDNSFEYTISSDIEMMQFVHIPIMLVQPFAENAIWHGLLNKKGMRFLKISFANLDDEKILCEIDDNGVGRGFKKTETGEIKKKSMALDFIRQRLDLIKQSTGIECSFEITDKVDSDDSAAGTLVRIIIPKAN